MINGLGVHWPIPDDLTSPHWTVCDIKVNRLVLALLAGVTGCTAMALAHCGGVMQILAPPLYLIGLVFAILSIQSRPEDEEAQLQAHRKRAQGATFAQTKRLHGLANIFKYDLLPGQLLQEKLEDHFRALKPEGIALLYLDFKRETEKAQEYRPMFVAAMQRAMASSQASELFQNPHIQSILFSGLASDALIRAETEYAALRKALEEDCAETRRVTCQPFLDRLAQFEGLTREVVTTNRQAQDWLRQVQQDIPAICQMKCAVQAQPELYPLLLDCPEDWADIGEVIESHRQLLNTFYKCRKDYDWGIAKQRLQFARAAAEIDDCFE